MKTLTSSLLAQLLFILTVQNSYSYTNSHELLPDSTITIDGVSSSLSGSFNFGPSHIILVLPSGEILPQYGTISLTEWNINLDSSETTGTLSIHATQAVPLSGAVWLLGSALVGLSIFRRKN